MRQIKVTPPLTTFVLTDESDRLKFFSLLKEAYIETLPIESDADMVLLRELGMPMPNSVFNRIWYPGFKYNKSFTNYFVEFTGILEERIPDGAIRSPFMLTWQPPDSNSPPLQLNVWRLRAWEKSTAVHVYQIYNPINDKTTPLSLALGAVGWATRIGGINATLPNIERQVKDAQIAAKGMLVLRKAMQSLQKKRGDELAPEEFRDLAFQALPRVEVFMESEVVE